MELTCFCRFCCILREGKKYHLIIDASKNLLEQEEWVVLVVAVHVLVVQHEQSMVVSVKKKIQYH